MPESSSNKRQSIIRVISSVLAAFIGVQSDKNRREDFTKGNIRTYVIAGLLGTIVFVLSLAGIVILVLKLSST